MPKKIFLILFYIIFCGCNSNSYPDDTYNATVEYYNPNSGRSRTYTLDVDVANNFVTVIYFNNSGWLDETHIISGGELDGNGVTEIESDKGYIYTVTIDR
jgi:hypothetical protein